MNEALKKYLNWSCNMLLPMAPNAADIYLTQHYRDITSVARKLLEKIEYQPAPLYRGIIMREGGLTEIKPHENLKYLSFSESRAMAEHFADAKTGFGTDIIDVEARLGEHGYVIEYTPALNEILFHHAFLLVLPYARIFEAAGMNGRDEVDALLKQMEVTILQPETPLPARKFVSRVRIPE